MSESGVLMTAPCFFNAIGNTTSFSQEYILSLTCCRVLRLVGVEQHLKSGWINNEIFIDMLKYFVKFCTCSLDDLVILIMDSHQSRIQLEVVEYYRANGVTLSHSIRLQSGSSLDRTVYISLNNNYNIACHDWILCNPIYDVAALFIKVYPKAGTLKNFTNGFKFTDTWSLKKSIFNEDDFSASHVKDRP